MQTGRDPRIVSRMCRKKEPHLQLIQLNYCLNLLTPFMEPPAKTYATALESLFLAAFCVYIPLRKCYNIKYA